MFHYRSPDRIIYDEEYRDRYYKSVDFAGGVNIDAIVAEINQNVESVSSVIGYENDTDVTDELGLPPHSFEIVAYGGLDQDVAQAIYRRKAAGIQSHGSTTVQVVSASGQSIGISFSRPAAVPVHIRINRLKTDPEKFPVDGMQQIKQALVDYIGDEKIVNTHIKNIRKKLGVDYIETMRGAGYKIEKED